MEHWTDDSVMRFADWLRLREPADAAARSRELVRLLCPLLPGDGNTVHDLGSGSGSMCRWLAPLLPGPQRWVLHDRDPALLEAAASEPAPAAGDRTPVTVKITEGDVTRLSVGDLAGATLITASALIDVLSQDELNRLVTTCVGTGVPTLIALNVTGRVELTPPDPLDEALRKAFNAHQRRSTGRGRLVGPAAPRRMSEAFRLHGHRVLVRTSPWLLDADDEALMIEWLNGWIGAALDQRPGLGAHAATYTATRRHQAASGSLRVRVEHVDLLALPPRSV